ncbi:hypothetical protein LMG28688_02499 [Paraburkholderia caffeinitolerans]|uniref:Potassium channel domain-containing protein n=1 Tax=Paraburkholderia caffeinitolerans TaxID=1723730 RepID=A0A6J5FYL2_9BURK|nr:MULTISPECIES: potassium channel family protein [Paraburkholderia]CAB3787592.1 hypothetical protein LMG28688_02499 [Paraburkholderia caffeinitolerans]
MVLMLFIVAVPFIEPTAIGRFAISVASTLIIVAAVASVGRSTLPFTIAVVLAVPALAFQWLALSGADPGALVKSLCFDALLYAATIVYLLRYVFQREVMTADKLFGAASAYLLIGFFWAYLYSLVDYFYKDSFFLFGSRTSATFYDLVYFSFTVLTSTGFGDITPFSRPARGICVVEQIVGALFVAILIARLAGVYPPQNRQRPDRTNGN